MKTTLLVIPLAVVALHPAVADAGAYSPLNLNLNGPDPFTVGCYGTFVDPGATARGKAVAIRAGSEHSLALWGNGRVAIWGGNRYQQQHVPSGLSDAVAIAAGGYHSLALRIDGTVIGWGENSRTQATPPEGLSNVVAIAGGGEHSLALRADGTVVGWGWNLYGQAQPPQNASGMVAIAAGAVHSLALKSNGTVMAWGAGSANGDFPDCGQSLVPADLSNVIAIAAGEVHSLALRSDGTVVGWGAGSTNPATWPGYAQASIPAGLSNVVAIAAGGYHSLALRADGTVLAWGSNEYGQTDVPETLSNAVAIAAGYRHSLALQADGKIVGWGWNEYGQAHDHEELADLSDRIVVTGAVLTNVPGSYVLTYTATDLLGHMARAARTVVVPEGCPGILDPTFDPTRGGTVPGIAGDFPAPWLRALALEPDGRIYVGGEFNAINGQPRAGLARLLFDGTLDVSFQPPWTNSVEVFALTRQPDGKLLVLWRRSVHHDPSQPGGGVLRLNADGNLDATFTNPWSGAWAPSVRCLALQADGRFLVGGEFMEPRTGIARFHADGALDDSFTPPLLPAYDGATVKSLVVQPDGRILAGGSYGIGLLRLHSDGSKEEGFAAELDVGGAVNAIQLHPDGRISVAGSALFTEGVTCRSLARLHADGSVDRSFQPAIPFVPRCLALQSNGRLLVAGEPPWAGGASEVWRLDPLGSRDTTFRAEVSVWHDWPHVNAMGLQPGGRILIGGDFHSVNGQPAVALARLDGGPMSSQVMAWGGNDSGQADVPDALDDAVALGGGQAFSVALREDGTIVTWGSNEFGQRNVPAGLSNVTAIAVGAYHTLALARDGTVVAWGDPAGGRTDVPPGLSNVIALAAGVMHSLALLDDGTVVAWGSNLDLNDEWIGQADVPNDLSNVIAIAAGDFHSVALKVDGSVACWGANDANQLDVPDSVTNLVAITAADTHTLGITSGGDWAGWGNNCPYFVPCSNLVAVASGHLHGLALTRDGRVLVCEIGGPDDPEIPDGLTNVTAVAAGRYHRLALCGNVPPVPLSLAEASWTEGMFRVRVPTMEGWRHALEFKNSLSETNWTRLPGVRGYGYGVGRSLADPAATEAQRFYRAIRTD